MESLPVSLSGRNVSIEVLPQHPPAAETGTKRNRSVPPYLRYIYEYEITCVS
jgi:hypothetical protein